MAVRLFGAAGVDFEDSFIPLLQETRYGPVLDERLVYRVFVHRTTIRGFTGNIHHRIVLCDKSEKYGFVTLELGKNATYSRVAPECQVYQGEAEDLEFKGTVEATMRELADIAIGILRDMGDYRLIGNNCQNFCNKFLALVDLKEGQYMTTPQQVGVGLAVGAGVAVLGAIAFSFFRDSRKREK